MVKALSKQIAQFQVLMLASQETITKDIAEVKQEVKHRIKGVKAISVKAKNMAQDNKEQFTQLKKMNVELSDRSRRVNLIIYGISEDMDQRNLEQCVVEWISEQEIELEGQQIERAHRLQSKRGGGNTQ